MTMRRSERNALRNRQAFNDEVKHIQSVNKQVQDYWAEQSRREQEAAETLKKNRGY